MLPLNSVGLPKVVYYKARSAAEIENGFFDGTERNPISPNMNVIMAQPMVTGVPAFCLVIFGTNNKYTSNDVMNRWKHIVNELEKKNITVVSIGSDSDPKYNTTMRNILKLGLNYENEFPKWFCASTTSLTFIPIQDPIHIGTKLRNRIINRDLRFGKHTIQIDHLKQLLEKVQKDKHNLTDSILKGNDRQNFEAVLRITNIDVINLLMSNIDNSEGTVLFLTITDKILRAFLDLTLKPIERIKYIWFATFILRLWKQFIKSNKDYNVRDDFISQNCYSCVEINAHSIVILMLRLKEKGMDKLFRTELLGSQPCENHFRHGRSMTSTNSTITNFSALQMIQRTSRIELMNIISRIEMPNFNFPGLLKETSSYYPSDKYVNMHDSVEIEILPDRKEIIEAIEIAKGEAIHYANKLGVFALGVNADLCCDIKPNSGKENIVTGQLSPLSQLNRAGQSNAYMDPLNSVDKEVLRLYHNLQLKNYAEEVDISTVAENSQYVIVRDEDSLRKCVKKHSLCWLMSISLPKLSSDRLLRVRGVTMEDKKKKRMKKDEK